MLFTSPESGKVPKERYSTPVEPLVTGVRSYITTPDDHVFSVALKTWVEWEDVGEPGVPSATLLPVDSRLCEPVERYRKVTYVK